MMDNLYQNWPVYLGVGGFVVFAIYAIIKSKLQEKKDKIAHSTNEDILSKK